MGCEASFPGAFTKSGVPIKTKRGIMAKREMRSALESDQQEDEIHAGGAGCAKNQRVANEARMIRRKGHTPGDGRLGKPFRDVVLHGGGRRVSMG